MEQQNDSFSSKVKLPSTLYGPASAGAGGDEPGEDEWMAALALARARTADEIVRPAAAPPAHVAPPARVAPLVAEPEIEAADTTAPFPAEAGWALDEQPIEEAASPPTEKLSPLDAAEWPVDEEPAIAAAPAAADAALLDGAESDAEKTFWQTADSAAEELLEPDASESLEESPDAPELDAGDARSPHADDEPALEDDHAAAAKLSPEVARLAERLRAGRCVLCAGPRLADGQLPLRELIARLLAALPADETREVWPVLEHHPLAAAGFVRRRLGEKFAAELCRASATSDELPDAVRLLAALPFRAAITTAYDDTIERAFSRDGRAPRIYTPRDAGALLADGKLPFVLKALGDPRRADTLVWSSEELRAALADADFRAAAHQLFASRSFLFVGFDARDLDLQILLERVLAGAPVGETEHFAVLPGLGAVEREELRAAWRIHVLADENLAELAAALHDAVAAPDEERPADDDYEAWLALLADDPTRADAIERLDRLGAELHERGDYDQFMELQLGRVAIEPEAGRRAEMLLTLARIFEHEADNAGHALTALVAAYKEKPSLASWHELERLAGSAGAWSELAADLGDALPSLPVSVRAPLYRRLERWAPLAEALDEQAGQLEGRAARAPRLEAAEIYAERLGDPAAAIARYQALEAEAPRDLTVLRALESLYDREGRQDDYLAALERQADAVDSERERAALMRRLALTWEEEPNGAARAAQCWETLLALEAGAEDALRALERLYRAARNWPELIETLRRRVKPAPAARQAELWAEIAGLYERELDDPEHAVDAWLLAEAAAPGPDAAEALTRLYERTGAFHHAVERYDTRARASEDAAQTIALMLRSAELCEKQLDDARGAETRLARVLELDPEHVPAMLALAALYRRSGEPLRAAKLLVEAAVGTPNRLERTRHLVDAGELYQSVDDTTRASELYLEALAIDPEDLRAGEGAAEILWREERHAELVPVLEMLVRKDASQKSPRGSQSHAPSVIERLVRLGVAARAAGLDDKAGKAFVRAAELDPAHLDAQRGRARHHLAREQWVDALSSLERVFQYHIDDLAEAERVDLLSEMGRCELKLGARQAAREFLQRALELDPTHRPSLLAQLQLSDAEPEALIDAMKALLVTAAPDEQVRLLGEIGDLCLAKLYDPARAVGAWAEALELRPDDHKLLHKCLDAFVEDRAWAQAVEMLERLIAVERSASVRAKYHHTAGLICRDELHRADDAAAHLRAALDDDPELERAAESLEQLFTESGAWRELARFYRQALKRLGPESPGDADGKNRERLRIWSALGDVCWHELGERESALAALEVALTLDGKKLDREKRLADLYVQAGQFPKAIAAHQHVLAQEKSRVLSYRALKHLYIQTSQREKSLLCSYALALLHKGEPDDARKVADYKQRPFATARRVLGEDGWARVLHPDEDRLLDCLFALVAQVVAGAQAQPHKALGLNRKEAIAADDPHSYSKALKYVTTTLDVPLPEAYARPEQKEAVLFANCTDGRALTPVLLLGGPLVGAKRREVEQVFELGRVAAQLRPERLLRLVMPHPQELAAIIEAAMAVAAPEEPVSDEVGRTALGLARALQPAQLEQLGAIGRKLAAANLHPEAAALAWLQATDLTALRAGWLLTGDLESSARLAAADGAHPGALAPTQRLLDLVWSTTTEELFTARRQLGLM